MTTLMKGNVLQLISIVGKSQDILENIVGFHSGRLAKGYSVWYLDEAVNIHDFEWGGSTRYPGNWIQIGSDIEEPESYARIEDIRRLNFYKGANFDEKYADHNFDLWKQEQADLLNDRCSPYGRIVKLCPVIPNNPKMLSSLQYPKAKGGAINQWELRIHKRFVFGAFVPPGSRLLGGGSGEAACMQGAPISKA